eukprot:c19796_g1_i1 orf=2-1984(-)
MGASSSMKGFLVCCWAMAMVVELASSQNSFIPPDNYLIKCGGQGNITDANRVWQGDSTLSNVISSSALQDSIAASSSNSSIGQLLSTARIFTQRGSYTFQVTPGRHWLRLYLYPFTYQNFTPSSATFSVTAGDFTLLSNFNPTTNTIISGPSIYQGNSGFVFKEYNINVTKTSLDVSFIPGSSSSYAFINAIELVSCPPQLVIDSVSPLGVNSYTSIGLPSMVLETMYRVNVGGPLVAPSNDTEGLYRTWLGHENNLITKAGWSEFNANSTLPISYNAGSSRLIAPPIVYSTLVEVYSPQVANADGLNISWNFPVDADYTYVIRLHFCELQFGTGGKRVFNIYLQNQIAYSSLDLAQLFKQYVAAFFDFSVTVQRDSNVLIQAGPPPNSGSNLFTNAIMNGIEVWKLNNSQNSLDGFSALAPSTTQMDAKSRLAPVVGGVIGGAAAVGLVMLAICCFCRQRAKVVKQPTSSWVPLPMHGGHSISVVSKTTVASGAGSYASSAQSSMGRIFAFSEILEATHNFDETRVIGVGGFGKVYQGELDDGTTVAIKRGNPRSEQGIMEFQTEIEMLSKLRHRHLVSLIGYCNENQEMVLVYEFMANGPLRSHLYGANLRPLTWRQRLEICIGAARGLHYLHTGATQSIIHRDVKTTNILLDENLVAK